MRAAAEIFPAILNGMWQAAVLAAAVWLALRYARRVGAATRYAIWWMTLAAVVALPFLALKPHTHPAPVAPVQATPTLERFHHLNSPTIAAPEAIVTLEESRTAQWPVWLFAIWAGVFLFRLAQIARGYLYLRGVKQRAQLSPHPLPARPRRVRLLVSDEIGSPMAAGFLHPAILLPTALAGEIEDSALDCVLLHEAAHIARRDDWANLAGRLLAAALAFHPVAIWILARIEREREMACDDWAVAHTGAVRGYAESLARMCEWGHAQRQLALASGVLGGRSRIRERIETLLASGRLFSPRASLARVALSGVALLALMALSIPAPRWITLAQRPEFEVASVKLNKNNGDYGVVPQRSGDLVLWHNTRLYTMIWYAYHFNARFQLVADMKPQLWWDWFDVDAKTPASTTTDDLRLMVQSLLEDRFKLKLHRETREMDAYHLVIAKNGSKLRAPDEKGVDGKVDDRPVHMATGRCGNLAAHDGFHLICAGAEIKLLVGDLMQALGGPVVDETGLTGTYDFTLTYMRTDGHTAPDAIPAPPVMEAIQADLGLKLVKGKAPVEVLVVDHVERPGENQ